jgi:predicted PurR-regulated permease PerM
MKDELTVPEILAPIGILATPETTALESEASPALPVALTMSKTALAQTVLIVLGLVAALYFARPVLLPIFLACVGAMTLKPVIRWSSICHIPPAISSAIVMLLLVAGVVAISSRFDRPAMAWVNDAPQHMTELRQRIQKLLPPGARFSAAAAAVNNLGATEAEKREAQKIAPTVQLKDNHSSVSAINWTELFLMGLIETLVLLYLLLASGDLFLQKLVHVMPTLGDKKRAVEISHEIQQNISNYLLSVTLINVGLGVAVSGGLYFMGLPNAGMWGIFVAVLNFVPYFGPVAGIAVLAAVGLLTFETSLWQALLPPAWYLLLHLLETNLVTPILLGRRFTLNPVVIFVSLIFWTWLWGVPGALLSLPILVSIKVISDHVPSLSSISEVLSR